MNTKKTSRRRLLRGGVGALALTGAARRMQRAAKAERTASTTKTNGESENQRATTDSPPVMNPWRLEPVDLRRFMRLGVEHILRGAIDLARRFADVNIAKTFTPEGTLTEAAGTHLHSTVGTVTSILDLGLTTGEKRYLDIGRKLYDVGLATWRTSWGWAKESRRHSPGRGEANNIGDYIEAALALAAGGWPEYYRDADVFIRNALLASQVLNTDWIVQADKPDTANEVYSRIRRRAYGAFAFTTPNGYHSYNTDLMDGALRALCRAQSQIIRARGNRLVVNLLFGTDTPHVRVRSRLPVEGRVEVCTRRPCFLALRLSDAVARETVRVNVGGRSIPPKTREGLVLLGPLEAETQARMTFDLPRRRTQEKAPGWAPEFVVDWRGDTVVGMQPAQGPIRLFPPIPRSHP